MTDAEHPMSQPERITLYHLMQTGIQRVELGYSPIKKLLHRGYLRRVPPHTEKFGLVDVTDIGRTAYEEATRK